MFPRIRELTDASGERLRVVVEKHPSGAIVLLDRPENRGCACVLLDGYGVDVLCGFIMAARLTTPRALPEERVGGQFPSHLRLTQLPRTAIVITQSHLEQPFEIPVAAWDRFYAELCMVGAHARELRRTPVAHVH